MLSLTTLLLVPALSASALAYPEAKLATRQSACADTHIFIGLGNNEQIPGRQVKLINAVCSGQASCDYENIQFVNPAGTPYCQSVTEGAANGRAQIISYNQRCPDSKLVVSGYSQGAHVVGDIIGGGGGTFFQDCVQPSNPGIDINSAAGRKIAAVLTFGDVRHTAFQPYNTLTGAGKNGVFPRPASQLANLKTYASIYHDFCVETDPICAGGNVAETHLNYFDIFTDEAAAFVKSKLAAGPRPTSAPVSSSTATTISVSTSASVPSNGTIILVPTYTLRPTTIPLPTYVPETMTSVMPGGGVVVATLNPIPTSVPVIPSATASVAVTVIQVTAPAGVLTTVRPSSGVASGTGSSPAPTSATYVPANGAMSVSVGAGSAVVGLVLAAVMALL